MATPRGLQPGQKRRLGITPSPASRVMANAGSDAQRKLDSLRNAAPGRFYAAAPLSGARNSTTTGLGQLNAQGGFDIFHIAASQSPVGENPYNNWLTSEARPQVDTYPTHVGIYLGVFGDDMVAADGSSQEIISAIVENSVFLLKVENTSIVIQPTITLPSGLSVDRKPSTTKANATVVTERFGDTGVHGLFPLPQGTIFSRERQLKAQLIPTPGLVTFLSGLTGNFPTAGSVIGVVVIGTQAQRVGAQR